MMIDSASSFVRGRLGSYRVVRLIGQGATSRVYLAEHIFLKRPTALKVLTCDFAQWPDFDLEIFEDTAVAAARLHHRNIVTLYDIDEVRARPYLLMEYVDGCSLHELIRRRGSLSPVRALAVLWEVAHALKHAHAAGIVHCDIKPGNILIDRRGTAKVTDFGLAQALHRADRSPFEGVVAGTPAYMAPEQILAERPDPRSDLYSLGVTFYEMVTGRSPFAGGSDAAVCARHMEQSRASLMRALPEEAAFLTPILHRLLARHPRDRYPNARELVSDLRPLLRDDRPRSAARSSDLHGALLRLGRIRKEKSKKDFES